VESLAKFLLEYGWVGLSVILMFVCAFLYRELKRKDVKIYELYERGEASAIKYVEGMERMRQGIERFIEKVAKGK